MEEMQKVGHDAAVQEQLAALLPLTSSDPLLVFTTKQLKGLLLAKAVEPITSVADQDSQRKKRKSAGKGDWAAQLFSVLENEGRTSAVLMLRDKQ
jgi:hypothetical protein